MSLSQETIRTVIGVITLVGATVGLYVGMQSNLASVNENLVNINKTIESLDRYDVHLQKGIDVNKERIIRLETRQESSVKNVEKLNRTLDNLGKEMRNLSETLIRMESMRYAKEES